MFAAESVAEGDARGRCRDGKSNSGVTRSAVVVIAPTCVCCMLLLGMYGMYDE